jgi:hypothetical protein
MKRALKLVGVLLVVMVAISFVAPFVSAQASERPPGCHDHGKGIPAPANYHCCVSGHNAAKLQVRFRLAGLTESVVLQLITEPLSTATPDAVRSIRWAPGFSAGFAPIRI